MGAEDFVRGASRSQAQDASSECVRFVRGIPRATVQAPVPTCERTCACTLRAGCHCIAVRKQSYVSHGRPDFPAGPAIGGPWGPCTRRPLCQNTCKDNRRQSLPPQGAQVRPLGVGRAPPRPLRLSQHLLPEVWPVPSLPPPARAGSCTGDFLQRLCLNFPQPLQASL